MDAYKVLRVNLCSLQLLGAPEMQYVAGVWNEANEPISSHPRKGGGLWVAPKLSDARGMQKYMKNKHGVETRIFKCKIDQVLHQTSCRIKTNKLFFIELDEVI